MHENSHDCKEGGCKHEISASNGDISSPHYPDYYPAKKDCVWIFSTTPGHRIKLVSSTQCGKLIFFHATHILRKINFGEFEHFSRQIFSEPINLF